MTTVLLILHLFVTLALIGVVLVQRSEGGGLGIGSSQGMGSFMSGRGTANLLTRTTAILGTVFFVLSLTLALMSRGTSVRPSVLDAPPGLVDTGEDGGSLTVLGLQPRLERAIHLWLMNRGFLVTPFHNMMLAAPQLEATRVDALVACVGACLDELGWREVRR